MKPLANFIMRGYSQATLVAASSALLSMLVPLLGLISAASVGLFTLRNGVRQGLLLSALATLATGILSALALGSPWPALGILMVLWFPLWGLAAVLRASRSLDLTVLSAVAGGLAIVLTVYLLVGDPAAYWAQLLEPLRESLVTQGALEASASSAVFGELTRWMTGAFAAALVLQILVSLIVARWWQATLYNPGGFGDEFRALRLNRSVGILALALIVGIGFTRGPGLVADLLLVLGIALVLQGLAVAHALRRQLGARSGWLFGLYLLLVLFMPQAELLVACVGLIDIWADIRARVAQRASGQR